MGQFSLPQKIDKDEIEEFYGNENRETRIK
jgi:hypothetical protein